MTSGISSAIWRKIGGLTDGADGGFLNHLLPPSYGRLRREHVDQGCQFHGVPRSTFRYWKYLVNCINSGKHGQPSLALIGLVGALVRSGGSPFLRI